MATAEAIKTISVTAGSVVSLYRFLQLAADGKVDHCGVDARADGVAAEAAAADGDLMAMALMGGKMKVEASAALTVGALVGSDATGKAKAAGTTVNNYSLGVVVTASAADGDIIEVLLHSPDRHGGT